MVFRRVRAAAGFCVLFAVWARAQEADSAGFVLNRDSLCLEQTARLRQAFADRDPSLFAESPLAEKCRPDQVYEMLYYQGFGHLFQERSDDALLHFALALEIGGDWDDQILFETYRLRSRRGERDKEDAIFTRLAKEFPDSPYRNRAEELRARIWRRVNEGLVLGGFHYASGDMAYEGPKARMMADWTLGAQRRARRVAGRLGITGRAALDGRSDQEFSAEAGVEIGLGSWTMAVDGGPNYSAYPETLGTYAPGKAAWEWQVSTRLNRDFLPASALRLQGDADFLAFGSLWTGGGGLRAEVQTPSRPFLSLRLEGSRVDPDCQSDTAAACQLDRGYGFVLAGGASWKPARQAFTASAIWRQDRDLDSGETRRETQGVEIRHRIPMGGFILTTRVEAGRKDSGDGWEPLLRGGLDGVWGW